MIDFQGVLPPEASPGDAPGRWARMRFYRVAPQLAPYITAIYLNEIVVPPGDTMVDLLHPEWANLRFIEGGPVRAAVGTAPRESTPSPVLAGPTSFSTWFETGTIRSWGVGFLPLGWCKFIAGPADALANRFVDAATVPGLTRMVDLREELSAPAEDPAVQAGRINNRLIELLADAPDDLRHVAEAQSALADPAVSTVSELAERAGVSERTLERLSRRAFGFTPKLLLRRQRFLRTLGEVMLNPQLRWSQSLDAHYFDQAHFNHDFRHFMALTPRQYMGRPHPIVDAAVRGRMAAAGAPMQVLHRPHAE